MLLLVALNILVFVILSGVIWKGGRMLEQHWEALERVTNEDRLLDDIDGDASHVQDMIHRYLDRPNPETLAEIDRLRMGMLRRLGGARAITDPETTQDIQRVTQTAEQLFSGFDTLRTLNVGIRDLYRNQILRLAGEIAGLYGILEQAAHASDSLQWPSLAKSREVFSAGLLAINAYYFSNDADALETVRSKLATITRTVPIMRDAARNDLERAAVSALAVRVEALGTAVEALGRDIGFQAHLLDSEIDRSQVRLSEVVHRLTTLGRQRQTLAQHRFYLSLGRVGGIAAVVGVTFLAVSILISLFIARSIARPIRELVGVMAAVARGDCEGAIPGLTAPDEIGTMARALAVFQDNALMKRRMEQALEAQERRWRTVLENSPVGISIVATEDMRRLYLNPRSLELLGVGSEAEAMSLSIAETFVIPALAGALAARALRDGAVIGDEVERRRADGSVWWCALYIRHIEMDGCAAFLVWQFDITERRQAEIELRAAKERAETALAELGATQQTLVESEKMAALGGLVAGVAHEINTPLGITLTSASLLHDESRRLSEVLGVGALRRSDLMHFLALVLESSELMLANCQRAAELIKSFKQVAVDQTSEERRTFVLSTYMEEVLISLGPKLRNSAIRVSIHCAADIEVDSFPGPLAQVLTNFIMNSLTHAFLPGWPGNITITATCPDPDAVELVYADDGCGIAEDVMPRIFDPFFTTARHSGGSGLGLNIVQKLVRQRLGGDVMVTSMAGHGTRFTLRFPRVA